MKTVPLQPEKNLYGGCFEKYGMLYKSSENKKVFENPENPVIL